MPKYLNRCSVCKSSKSEGSEEFQNQLNDNLKWLGGAEDQLEQISAWIDAADCANIDEAKDAFQNLKIDLAARQKEIDKTFETGNKIPGQILRDYIFRRMNSLKIKDRCSYLEVDTILIFC